MKFNIFGTTLQTLNIEIKKGEIIYAQKGAMSWMSENINWITSIKGGLINAIKRKFSGETFFLTKFFCERGTGVITFSNDFPGKIIPISLDGKKEYICQKNAFLCAEESVILDIHLKKRLGRGFFGGEGFILQKLSGKGTAFVAVDGEVTEVYLNKDEVIKVDTGHIALYESSVDYDITRVKNMSNIFFGGEGLFLATLKGPGRVWLQSMPLYKLARKFGLIEKRGLFSFIGGRR